MITSKRWRIMNLCCILCFSEEVKKLLTQMKLLVYHVYAKIDFYRRWKIFLYSNNIILFRIKHVSHPFWLTALHIFITKYKGVKTYSITLQSFHFVWKLDPSPTYLLIRFSFFIFKLITDCIVHSTGNNNNSLNLGYITLCVP